MSEVVLLCTLESLVQIMSENLNRSWTGVSSAINKAEENNRGQTTV